MSVGKGGQKQRLKQAMKSLRHGLGIDGVFWTRWRDGGGGCKWCRHAGLLSKKGKAKPAWGAYKKFLKTLGTEPAATAAGARPVLPRGRAGRVDRRHRPYLMKRGRGRGGAVHHQLAAGRRRRRVQLDQDRRGVQAAGVERHRAAAAALRQPEPGRATRSTAATTIRATAVMNGGGVRRRRGRPLQARRPVLDRPSRVPAPAAARLAGLQRAEHPRVLAERAVAEQVRGASSTAPPRRSGAVDPTAKIMLGGMHGDDGHERDPVV